MAIGMLAAAVPAGAGAAPTAPQDAYRISVMGGHYTGEHQSVAIRRIHPSRGPTFWVAERRKRITAGITGPTSETQHDWIDGRTCPQLSAVISTIEMIPPPPSLPSIVFHGRQVQIAKAGPGGKFTGRSDYEGRVADWWKEAETQLMPCWSVEPVTVDGRPLAAQLDTDEAEQRFRPLPW